MYPGCIRGLLVLLHPHSLHSLSAPHRLSLCLVCLPSQLLSKKRGLFRIHAGRKQRYPQQQSCARGTLKRRRSITLTSSATHPAYLACSTQRFVGRMQWLSKCFLTVNAKTPFTACEFQKDVALILHIRSKNIYCMCATIAGLKQALHSGPQILV